MDKPRAEKDVEEYIRMAFAFDRLLPHVGPKQPHSPLGRMVTRDDAEMGLDDRHAESQSQAEAEKINHGDYEIWDIVMTKWLTELKPLKLAVIARRAQGMGWKLIAYELHASKRSVQRWYGEALRAIFNKLK